MKRFEYLFAELKDHLPFSIFFTAAGITMAGLLMYIAIVAGAVGDQPAGEHTAVVHEHRHVEEGEEATHEHVEEEAAHRHGEGGTALDRGSWTIFHIFHPVHMLFSAIATTAMFWRYDRKLVKAIIVGFFGAALVCGISDVMLPYLSAKLLGVKMHFHICIIEHPGMVLPFLAVGIGVGLLAAVAIERSTVYSHSAHVFVSSIASLFYLVAFGMSNWVESIGYVFVVVVLAVMLPCCMSDIVFPLLLVHPPEADAAPHGHQ